MTTISKQPWSRYVRIILYLAIGYAPMLPFFYFLTDIQWGGLYDNEAIAWAAILSVFDILAIISAVKILRVAPVFAIISILLALVPLTGSWLSWLKEGIGPSSKEDQNPYRGMLDFWAYGGGAEVILFVLLPLTALYLYLRYKERRATTRPLAPT